VDQARLGEVSRRYGVARLLVFGSVARGSASAASDVEVLYELVPERRLGWEVEDLADDLADIFGRPVDLVSVTALHDGLKSAVLAEALPLYAA
jgi:predicted nucleotidyltransferase